ncbi:hypothetical protein AB0P21_29575 [Kribbella sp. NPDC056861]|uniref:hypothetical protein n=1 Tax=Kribbella sp. NPDC056861 TaxID=3154857 RepID=UPI00343E0EAB
MPRLTDEEVGQLLRETFTEKEQLLDRLPVATTRPVRRWRTPLVAAAAVIAVLGGPVSTVQLAHQGEDPPMSVVGAGKEQTNAKVSVTAAITGAAIAELVKHDRPAVIRVLDSPYRSAGNPAGAGISLGVFTAADRRVIVQGAGVAIEWVNSRPKGCGKTDGTPYVTAGQVVIENGSTATIGMSKWTGCLGGLWLTYRLKNGSGWHVTGTVGPQTVS